MRVTRCFPEAPKATFETYPADDEFDTWIERARQQWADQNGLNPAKLQVICAMAIVP